MRSGYSGPEAAKLIERETFDIVITDMVMNDLDGMQILKLAGEGYPIPRSSW